MALPMLGKKAVRHDPRTLRLAKYLLPDVQVPQEVSWVTHVSNWPMMGNDSLGDCVEAAAGHMIEQWTKYAEVAPVIPSDSDIVAAYSAIAGYVPGDPSTDNGTDMLSALNYWRKTGIAGHKVYAFVKLAAGDLDQLRFAVWLFGNAYIGVNLPAAVQSMSAWTVPDSGFGGDGAPGSWGGHCIPVVAVSPKSATVVTWGQTLKMSHNFYRAYSDEAYAVLSLDWMTARGVSPGSFNFAQLKADLSAF